MVQYTLKKRNLATPITHLFLLPGASPHDSDPYTGRPAMTSMSYIFGAFYQHTKDTLTEET